MKNLLLLIMLVCLSSCINKEETKEETRTITDALGRDVLIPKEITRLITIDRGFSPQVLKVLGKDTLLVGTGGVYPRSGPYTREKSDTFFLVPHILEISNVGWAGYGNYDFEKILEVAPQVIVIVAYDGMTENSYHMELLERLENEFKIPVVILEDYSSIQGQASIDSYYNNIRILGEITNTATEKTEGLISKLENQIKKAQSFRVDGQTDRMLFLGVNDPETGGGYVHGQDFSGAAFTTSLLGIPNVLTNSDIPILGAEQILEFNPDIIAMVDAPVSNQAVQIYLENPIFQSITAVQNKRVYFTGQLQWWSDSKLMLPLQLILFSAIYYQPENTDYKTLYAEYMSEIFGLSEEDSVKLATIHRLDSLLYGE